MTAQVVGDAGLRIRRRTDPCDGHKRQDKQQEGKWINQKTRGTGDGEHLLQRMPSRDLAKRHSTHISDEQSETLERERRERADGTRGCGTSEGPNLTADRAGGGGRVEFDRSTAQIGVGDRSQQRSASGHGRGAHTAL